MTRTLKSLGAQGAAWVLALAAILFFSVPAHAQDDVPLIGLEELRAKHQLPNSRYIDVDGISVHYVIEGEGPTVVLLHASYNSLLTWSGAAEELAKTHRVIRFDFPGAGLTGFETKPIPDEKYYMIDRYREIMGKLLDKLGVNQFALVGTSSGGTVAFNYAAENPDRVERLVLINSAGMPRTAQTNPLRERGATSQWANQLIRPREFWEIAIGNNFLAPNVAPEWMIDQSADFGRKDGLAAQSEYYLFRTGDPKSVLAKIEAPTLIMWGKSNPTVMHLEADVFSHWITGAPTAVRKYEGLGHYPYVEDLPAILSDLQAFLSGEMDGELRQTMRVKVEHSPVE